MSRRMTGRGFSGFFDGGAILFTEHCELIFGSLGGLIDALRFVLARASAARAVAGVMLYVSPLSRIPTAGMPYDSSVERNFLP